MNPHYDRALLLYQQSRYDLAEQELHHALADEPNNPLAHSLSQRTKRFDRSLKRKRRKFNPRLRFRLRSKRFVR